MNQPSFPRLTPWVGRLMAATAVSQLLLETVLTSDRVLGQLIFSPASGLERPWTFLTYMFVHGGLLHLAFNLLGLYVFGGAVEERMGGPRFVLYYLYCGSGAALLALLLSLLHFPVPGFIGASGAVLGVALAFATYLPDAEFLLFPLPVPVRAKTLVIALALANVLYAVLGVQDGVAHLAHVGGLLFGWLWFRIQNVGTVSPEPRIRRVEQVVMAQSTTRSTPPTAAPSRPMLGAPDDPMAAEVDRVLDKISARGIASLTPDERRFLDEVARRKQRDLH